MKHLRFVAALAVLSLQAPVFAADAPAISKRATIYSAEGTKIGKVEKVLEGPNGAEAVRVIYRGKFLTIPASSLTPDEKGLKTSLTNADIKKL